MQRLHIAEPCTVPWDGMVGAESVRRCAVCARDVHDLSAFTATEAAALVLLSGGRGVCVRFEADAAGEMRLARPAPAPRASVRMATLALGAAAATACAAPPLEPAAAPPEPPHAPVVFVAAAIATPPPPADQDGDGIPDVLDACPNEPGVASDDPAKNGCPPARLVEVRSQGEVVIIQAVRFDRGGTKIPRQSEAVLDAVAEAMARNPQIQRVSVEGHASVDEPRPEQLGERRAQVAIAALVARKVDRARLVARSWGHDRPIAPNQTQDGRERNRRVEFRAVDGSCPAPGAPPVP